MTPKIFILSSDASGQCDAIITKQILDFLPNRVDSIAEADVVVTDVLYRNEYRFNRALYDVKCPVVCLDFLEFGWSWGGAENRLGHGILAQCGHLNTPEYAKLDQWVKDCPPRLTFKRELLASQKSESMLPIEFLCTIDAKPKHTREQYEARAFEVLNVWGLSHHMRQRIHGEIFTNAHRCGYSVIDNFAHEQHLEKRNWATIYSPWFARKSLEEVIRWQRRAKISVSLFGAGRKSFRDAESPVDCLMARPVDNMAWSYPWTEENSISLRGQHLFEDLEAATHRSDLYEKYLAGLENIEKYRSANYVRDYIMPAIAARI